MGSSPTRDFIVTHNTWFEVYIGAYCQLQNCTVLQFVTEMSEDIMRDRYEAMLFSMMYGDLNYNAFKSGTLSPEVEQQYFQFLEEDLPYCEPLIIVLDFVARILQYIIIENQRSTDEGRRNSELNKKTEV